MSPASLQLPVFALVDDQVHSARLLARTLQSASVPARVKWVGDSRRATRKLADLLGSDSLEVPDMIIVDLKTHSNATAEFVAAMRADARSVGIPIVAIAGSLDPETRGALLCAGASAVFERLADLEAYRAEMAQITRFWVRETLTWPIRA